MRRPRQRLDDTDGVDMTPMLDIVFIMLIFFIVTAVFLDERGIDLTEPPPSDLVAETPTILVSLDANDQAVLDGQFVSLAAITSRIQALRASQPNAAIVLSADAKSSVAAVVALKDDLDAASVPMTLRVQR